MCKGNVYVPALLTLMKNEWDVRFSILSLFFFVAYFATLSVDTEFFVEGRWRNKNAERWWRYSWREGWSSPIETSSQYQNTEKLYGNKLKSHKRTTSTNFSLKKLDPYSSPLSTEFVNCKYIVGYPRAPFFCIRFCIPVQQLYMSAVLHILPTTICKEGLG